MKFIKVHTLEPEYDEYWTAVLENTKPFKIQSESKYVNGYTEHRTGKWLKKLMFINTDTILWFRNISPEDLGQFSDTMPKEVRTHLKSCISQLDEHGSVKYYVVESCDEIAGMINK